MRKFVLILTLASLFVLTCVGTAFAFTNHTNAASDRTMVITASNCFECHADSVGHTNGPHGGYTSATDKCQACHDVHGKGENAALLMGYTLTAACQYCHDLTATWAGPYNMYGVSGVGAAHRVVGIDVYSYIDSENSNNEPLGVGLAGAGVIPGGNANDGSSGGYNGIFNLTTQKNAILSDIYFTCNSCHTPHGAKTVAKYLGESPVKYSNYAGENRLYLTNRILRQAPNETLANLRATVPGAVYQFNSTWCLGCHAGRDTLNYETVHNHPVDELAPGYRLVELALLKTGQVNSNAGNSNYSWTTQADFYTALNAGTFAGGRSYITFGGDTKDFDNDPRLNQQFALTPTDYMTGSARPDSYDPLDRGYDPVAQTGGVYVDKGPACQQCHGSARNVEAAWTFNTDDLALGNPNRASFPHVSVNKALLVETGDDFCTNCHDPNILP